MISVEVYYPLRWIHKQRGAARIRQHVLRKNQTPILSGGIMQMLCGAELGARMTGTKTKKPKVTIGMADGIECCPKCLKIMDGRERKAGATAHAKNGHSFDEYGASLVRLAKVRAMALSGEARRIRTDARLSLQDIAGSLGVDQSTVWTWEKGTRKVTGSKCAAYLDLLEALRGDASANGPIQ